MGNPIVAPIPWLSAHLWQAQDEGGAAFRVKVYKMAWCPCGSKPGEPARITCAACGGTGLLYPLPPREILALISDLEQHSDLVQAGLMTYGDLVISTQPGQDPMNDYDLCILPMEYGVPAEGQVIARGSGTTDDAWYRLQTVEGAWTVDADTGVVAPYTPGTDFTWDGKVITWLSANQPSQGQNYTIRYTGRFEWVAFDPPSPRQAFGQDLGQRAVLRKRHVILPNAPTLLES